MSSEMPNCPRCKSNANVMRTSVGGYRCVFCGDKFYGEEGQQKLC